jgi:hypothetical protein
MMGYMTADSKQARVNNLASIIAEINSTLENVCLNSKWLQYLTAFQPVDGSYVDNIEQSKAIMAQLANSIKVAARRAGL